MPETHQLRIAPNETNESIVPPKKLNSLEFNRTHTGISDGRVIATTDYDLEDLITEEVWIEDGSELLFRGYFNKISNSIGPGELDANISFYGVEKDLQRTADTYTFENILSADAIQDVWDDSSFTATVNPPDAIKSTTDYEAQSATSLAEFEGITDIPDETPITFGSNGPRAAQICYNLDPRDPPSGDAIASDQGSVQDDKYTDGTAVFYLDADNFTEFEITPEYTIPAEKVEISFLIEGLDTTGVDVNVSINGEIINPSPMGWNTNVLPDFDWYGVRDFFFPSADPTPSFDLQEGQTYSVEVNVVSQGNNGAAFDHIAIFDTDFESALTFDNTVDSAGGQIDGPELYPPVGTAPYIEFNAAGVPWTVTDINASGTFNDTTGDQSIGVRIEGGTYTDSSNSTTVSATPEASFSEVGPSVEGRVRLGGYPFGSSPQNDTPRFGYNAQEISSWTLEIDGDDRPSINNRTFDGTLFSILQDLHTSSDMRFHFEYERNSKPAFSYRAGEEQREAPNYSLKRESRTLNLTDYYNKVRVRGARVNGERLLVELPDQDGIDDYGIELAPFRRPDIESEADLGQFARQQLNAGLRQEEYTGEIEFSPAVSFPPGVSIPVTWSDGTETTPSIEEVSYSVSAGDLTGTIMFDLDPIRIESTQSGLRNSVGTSLDAF